MKNILIAICGVFFSSSAFADCESNARAAYARITTSGPYHFEKVQSHQKKSVRLIGELIPGDGLHLIYDEDIRKEYLSFKSKGNAPAEDFRKDRFGWIGTSGALWVYNDAANINEITGRHIIGYNCSGTTTEDGREVLVFELTFDCDKTYIVYKYGVFRDFSERELVVLDQTMFVDPLTRLPVKFETRSDSVNFDFVSVESRRYDAGLKVEAPIKGE